MISSERTPVVRRLLGTCLLACLLSACQPSMDEVIAEHRAAVQGVFGKLKALDAPARSAPPTLEDTMAAGGARVVLDGQASNALFILAEDLQAPEFASSDGVGATYAKTVQVCGEALRGEAQGVPKGIESFMKECGRAEYVFVLRRTAEESAQSVDNDSFQAGMYEGDVLLFRLADGSSLGGFRVSAKSSDQIMAQVDANGNPVDISERLESDLSAELFADIGTKIRKHLPGALP